MQARCSVFLCVLLHSSIKSGTCILTCSSITRRQVLHHQRVTPLMVGDPKTPSLCTLQHAWHGSLHCSRHHMYNKFDGSGTAHAHENKQSLSHFVERAVEDTLHDVAVKNTIAWHFGDCKEAQWSTSGLDCNMCSTVN